MKISLNRANKLRDELEALVIPVTTAFTIMEGADNYKELHAEVVKNAMTSYEDNHKKIGYTYMLRSLIHEANFTNNITLDIGKIAYLEAYRKYLGSRSTAMPVGGATTVEDYEAYQAHREKITAIDPSKVAAPRRVSLRADLSVLEEQIKSELVRTKKELRSTQEERNKKNHTAVIELPDDLVEFCEKYSLL